MNNDGLPLIKGALICLFIVIGLVGVIVGYVAGSLS